jgi:hypothetical protein
MIIMIIMILPPGRHWHASLSLTAAADGRRAPSLQLDTSKVGLSFHWKQGGSPHSRPTAPAVKLHHSRLSDALWLNCRRTGSLKVSFNTRDPPNPWRFIQEHRRRIQGHTCVISMQTKWKAKQTDKISAVRLVLPWGRVFLVLTLYFCLFLLS